MRRIKIYFVIAVLTVMIASCTSATPTNQPEFAPTVILEENPTASREGLPRTEDEVPRVSLEETLAAIESGEAVVVDVRSAQAYQASHIPGAISIPLGEIETNPTGLNLDKDLWIITYCT
jgi:phosphohistidine swiveling domain-containing protein